MALTAVLLAGGESRRLGRDKATTEWRGRALWELQLEKLRALNPTEILLSARSDPPWRPSDVRLVLDAFPSRGPLSGLTAALASARSENLIVLAVDMPFMTLAHLQDLCALASAGKGVIPMIEERAEPLSAIYPLGACALFQEALQSDDFSLQSIVRKLIASGMVGGMPVSEGERVLYKSVNEAGDLG